MRIMHVAWEYPPLVYGGLGRHVYALATAQASLGHDVTVVTQRAEGAPPSGWLDGVRVVRRAVAPDVDFIPDHLLQWVGELDRSLAGSGLVAAEEFHPEVVHCHDWMTTQAGRALTDDSGRPLVVTMHATEQGRHQGHLHGTVSLTIDGIERRLCTAADAVIVCSTAMREEVMRQFQVPGDRVTVIPNGIDTTSWTSPQTDRTAARRRWATGGPLLLYTGRLEVEKGIYTLLDAMPAVIAAEPSVRLVVAGNGGQAAHVEAGIAERNISGNVSRAGWLPERDLRALIGAADAAIVPSLYEPFGLVALEAMSLGTPVVAARTGGLADIVRNGETGTTFPPGDSAALAQALLSVIRDPVSARAKAATASSGLGVAYDWSRIAATTLEVYRGAGATEANR